MGVQSKHYYRFVYLKSEDWQNKRLRKLALVDAVCKICKVRDLSNDVHHITYRNLKDVRNGDLVVLCRTCHTRVHKILEVCTEIKDASNSRARWRRTMSEIRKQDSVARFKWQSQAIKLMKKMRKSILGLSRPKYSKLFTFLRAHPTPTDSQWVNFCGLDPAK